MYLDLILVSLLFLILIWAVATSFVSIRKGIQSKELHPVKRFLWIALLTLHVVVGFVFIYALARYIIGWLGNEGIP